MNRQYSVVRDDYGFRRLIGEDDEPLHKKTDVREFTMEQAEPKDDRQKFDQKLDAAFHAESIVGENILWIFNGVALQTDMQHRGDLWAIYTELSADLAN